MPIHIFIESAVDIISDLNANLRNLILKVKRYFVSNM